MPPSGSPFSADRNQVIAVVAMLAAVFAFAMAEIMFGFALFAVAAVFSIGGLFWNAHMQDVRDKNDLHEMHNKAAAAKRQHQGQNAGPGISED